MNKDTLVAHIDNYKSWLKDNEAVAIEEQKDRQKLSIEYQSYTEDKILSMSEEDIYNYIAPLWAMLIWGNKQYVVDNLISNNSLEKLKKQIANLVWGSSSIEDRWDIFRKNIKGIGPAMMSELLSKTHPNKYIIWNRRALVGFDYLEIPNLPRYDYQLDGKKYKYICEQGLLIGKTMHKEKIKSTDLLAVDYFIWQELQVQENLSKLKFNDSGTKQETPIKEEEAEFIHNDVRDKIAEIGQWLGFQSDIEKKIADGAVVDSIWEVTIGNMGRVIYVFEVQTAGSIDSLILNLMRAKNNKAVQGIIAVTNKEQIEVIKREIKTLPIKDDIKYWDYEEVLKVHESLQYVNESINNLGLVPTGL